MANLDQIMNHLADTAITEIGTSGFWTYIKYANGVAVCWGETTENNTITAWGNMYGRTLTANTYPTGLFIENPSHFSFANVDGGESVCGVGYVGTQTNTPRITVLRPAALTGTKTFHKSYLALGKWK